VVSDGRAAVRVTATVIHGSGQQVFYVGGQQWPGNNQSGSNGNQRVRSTGTATVRVIPTVIHDFQVFELGSEFELSISELQSSSKLEWWNFLPSKNEVGGN
jgi:hypothetical protein